MEILGLTGSLDERTVPSLCLVLGVTGVRETYMLRYNKTWCVFSPHRMEDPQVPQGLSLGKSSCRGTLELGDRVL